MYQTQALKTSTASKRYMPPIHFEVSGCLCVASIAAVDSIESSVDGGIYGSIDGVADDSPRFESFESQSNESNSYGDLANLMMLMI